MKKSCRGNYFNTDPQNTECLKLVEDFNRGTTARWERCNYNVQCNKNIKSSIPHIEGYRSLIFGGDHDMTNPFVGTRD
ncbi:hypothetical protein YC2023_089706 [Brassica napus]